MDFDTTQFMTTFRQLPTQVFLLISMIWSGLIVLSCIVQGQIIPWLNLIWFMLSAVLFLIAVGVMG